MQIPNRVAPQMPAESMKSYLIASPRDTHTRAARCVEVDCDIQKSGWETFIDEGTALGQRQGYYIRKVAGRQFSEAPNENGITVFTFAAGSECFTEHRVSIDRPEIFAVRGGDWRGNPRGEPARIHDRPEDWVEDFAEHQDALTRAQD